MDTKDASSKQETPLSREDRIQRALSDLRANKYPTPNAAAEAYDLNSKTLRERWTGKRQAPNVAHEGQMILTIPEQHALTAWCIHSALVGRPFTRETVGGAIYDISGRQPSTTYIDRFISRNEQLVMRKPTGLDPKRARAFNRPTVEQYFALLKYIVTNNYIPPSNEYNMDEKGIQLGGGRKGNGRKFICGRVQRIRSVKLRHPDLKLVTVVECIPALGAALPPGFILPATEGNHRAPWFERAGVGSVAVSESGWTDDELTFLWFKRVFIPSAMARNPNNQPILLIMDGHGSHCTEEMIDYGRTHKPPVHLLLLPPHTTHRLQPLDVGVFGVAQRLYLDRADLRTYEGNPITLDTVVSEWMDLRPRFMTEKILASSWAHTGNYPINPNVFTDADYAPSQNSSTRTHLPMGYPVDEITSDDEDSTESGGELNQKGSHTGDGPTYDQDQASGSARVAETQAYTVPGGPPQTTNTLPSKGDLRPPAGFRIELRQDVHRELARLRAIGEAAIEEAERARAHAVLMARENGELRRKLNAPKKPKLRKLNTKARFLTGEEGQKLRDEAIAKETEDAAIASERAEKLRQLEDSRQRRREAEASTRVWQGAWWACSKPDVQNLGFALGLSIEGTKAEIVERIKTHLDATPALAADKRFAGLYTPVTRGRRRKPPQTLELEATEQEAEGNESAGQRRRGQRTGDEWTSRIAAPVHNRPQRTRGSIDGFEERRAGSGRMS